MPKMMTIGTSIGEGIIEFFEVLEKEGIGAAMGVLFKDVDVGALIWDALAKAIPVFVAADFIAGLFKWGDGTDTNGLGYEVNAWFSKGLEEATTDWDDFWTKTSAWFSGGIAGITSTFTDIWTSITTWFDGTLGEITYGAASMFGIIASWFSTGLTTTIITFTSIWDSILSWFKAGLTNVTINAQSIVDTIVGAVTGGGGDYDGQGFHKADKNQSGYITQDEADDFNFWNPLSEKVSKGYYDKVYGSGGIINEPISGIGLNSGQSYLMGESGSEMITPMGKSGGGITINIQNMNGSDDDMRKLKKTILDVLQESSASRGRI